jgi:hypothetical protein
VSKKKPRFRKHALPERDYDPWIHNISEEQLDELQAAAEVLHGRNATVFDALVLAPLRGESKRTVESLAHQFGVNAARIHRCKNRAKSQVVRAIRRRKSLEPKAPSELIAFIEGVPNNERCTICGRGFSWTDFALCNGVFGQTLAARSECLQVKYRARKLDLLIAEYREACRARDSIPRIGMQVNELLNAELEDKSLQKEAEHARKKPRNNE